LELDLIIAYDGSHLTQTAIDEGKNEVENGLFVDNIHISLFPSYELMVHKVSVIIQPGFTFIEKHQNQSPIFINA